MTITFQLYIKDPDGGLHLTDKRENHIPASAPIPISYLDFMGDNQDDPFFMQYNYWNPGPYIFWTERTNDGGEQAYMAKEKKAISDEESRQLAGAGKPVQIRYEPTELGEIELNVANNNGMEILKALGLYEVDPDGYPPYSGEVSCVKLLMLINRWEEKNRDKDDKEDIRPFEDSIYEDWAKKEKGEDVGARMVSFGLDQGRMKDYMQTLKEIAIAGIQANKEDDSHREYVVGWA